ncbi:hypothetical protein [Chamaesiphon minutus]|uniref:VOC domain-containing protein n=1 Tax=Chamaesiphon minutus (strain ATCC 27169 / PCC 6605) TaxID=1173020 RepID=K9UGE2_CHAP6|nr:hypothetical protein [Chamaesiphon minutus]AFY93259.1 hypothetical protein Cha6605_2175 [Chamaesiphon minutus PCC 6605]
MIHHFSIAAHHPLHVSQVLAEILQGQSVPFPGHPGSHVALAFDPQGTMVEVHPFGTALFPGDAANEPSHLLPNPAASIYTANHTAISVPVSTAQIQSIAEREGWRMAHCRRGDNYFDVIEFWVENQLLIELLPPELVDRYLAFMSPESLVAAAQAAAAQQPTAA